MLTFCIILISFFIVIVVLYYKYSKTNIVTNPDKTQINNIVKKLYNKSEVENVTRLCEISHQNKTPIFPRNGFLLGILRHKGFLPNEKKDIDLACFEDDVPAMLESDWGEYKIDKHFFGGYAGKKMGIKFDWDSDFNNLRHPITNRKYKYFLVKFTHIPTGWTQEVDCVYRYKPGYYYYPWYSAKYTNSTPEFKLQKHRCEMGGGAKILLGHTELPITKLYQDSAYKGKVAEGLFEDWMFKSYYKTKFYNKEIYVPIGSKQILKDYYGNDVFEIMIDKKGNKLRL